MPYKTLVGRSPASQAVFGSFLRVWEGLFQGLNHNCCRSRFACSLRDRDRLASSIKTAAKIIPNRLAFHFCFSRKIKQQMVSSYVGAPKYLPKRTISKETLSFVPRSSFFVLRSSSSVLRRSFLVLRSSLFVLRRSFPMLWRLPGSSRRRS